MAGTLAAVKKDMRKWIRGVLKELPEAVIASQTSSATQTLLSLPEYKAARRISVYLSMPTGEISTLGIVRDALAQGKKVFIPYTYNLATSNEGQPKSIMDMVELQSTEDLDTLQPDNWGIPTPSEESISSRANSFGGIGITKGAVLDKAGSGLDLIVMPGMVFDSQFGRLGHGKGFYDYFLTRCHQAGLVPHRSWPRADRTIAPSNRIGTHGTFRLSPGRPHNW